MRKIIVLFMAIFLCGCATTMLSLKPEARKQIQEREFNADYNRVFKAILTVFEDKGFSIDKADRDGGFINTDWKEQSGYLISVFGVRKRVKITAYTDKNENDDKLCTVRLNMFVQSKGSFGNWENYDLSVKDAQKYYDGYFGLIEEKVNNK